MDDKLKGPTPPDGKHSLTTDGVAVVIVERTGAALDARTGREAKAQNQGGVASPSNVRISVEGDSIRVYGDKSTTPVWTVSGAANNEKAYVDPVVTPEGVFIVEGKEITRRDIRSGAIDRRWTLPPYFERYVDTHALRIVTDGHRFVLTSGFYESGPSVMATGSDASQTITVFDRPTFITRELVVLNGAIVFYDPASGTIGACELATRDAPLASLSPAAAFAAVRAEMVPDEEPDCWRLFGLPKLEKYWLRILEAPVGLLQECALLRFEQHPHPQAASILRRLADAAPPEGTSSRGDIAILPAWDGRNILTILRVLAAEDSRETSQWLAAYIQKAERDAWTGPLAPRDLTWTVTFASNQIWRTGRSSEVGLCPREPTVRHLDALDQHTADGSIGTTRPLLFNTAAPDGRWCVVCQPRQEPRSSLLGDAMSPHLVVGSGPGWPSDEFVSSSPSGRYVAVREGLCATIVDTETNQAVTLPNADMRDDGIFGVHRGVAFDASSTRVLYLRGGDKPSVVVRDLSSGAEQVLDPGPGFVESARFDPEGRGIEVDMNPSGEWNEISARHAERRCDRRIALPAELVGETPYRVRRYLPLDGGTAIESNGLFRMFDGGWLVRKSDGSIALRDSGGVENVMVPAVCHGVVRHADASRHLLVVTCGKPYRGASLWIFGDRDAKRIGETYTSEGDKVDGPSDRFVPIDDLYVDMEARRVVPQPPIPAGRIRLIRDWNIRKKGLFAERSDGSALRRAPRQGTASPKSFPGPLIWSQAAQPPSQARPASPPQTTRPKARR